MSDRYLIELYQMGFYDAFATLTKRYYHKSKILARKYFFYAKNAGVNFDDVITIAFEQFVLSLDFYDTSYPRSFYSYWLERAELEIKKHLSNSYFSFDTGTNKSNISLDAEISTKNNLTFGEVLGEEDVEIKGEVDKDDFRNLIKPILDKFTNEEYRLYVMLKKGFSREEMAKELNLSISQVYERIRNIRRKLKKALEKNK